ncbi:helix-turn-helix domain-containing protein [Solirhodobacter olei]|uniref:AlbA family DNA-binding domain-containing protein n=1 Tax=Solirhodobacter olei TaxID=2493082 RepID=UPI000FDB75AE|nr:ATP-binding protein [Solirhodobacter olei]
MLLGKNFDEIDSATIQALVGAGATESVHLEFKRDPYGSADSDKKEFLKDVSAFANALGGHLLIGVDEVDGAASAVTPIVGIDVDKELLRLESVVRTGIEPAIVGVRMKRIQAGVGDVIVIQIPRSYNPPHRIIFKGSNRYHSRSSSGTYELSLEELRTLFGQFRSVEERAKTFMRERLLRVQANDGAMPLPVEVGAMIMHLVPLPDFGSGRRHELSELRQQSMAFAPLGASGYTPRVNLDGFLLYRGGPVCRGYTQVFRDGSVEATSVSMIAEMDGRRLLPSVAVPERIMQALRSYMTGLRAIDASSPILLQVSFLAMNGVGLGIDPMRVLNPPPTYGREELHLPASIISEYRNDEDYQDVVAEQMDFLWNVFDFERCFYFNSEGKWAGP